MGKKYSRGDQPPESSSSKHQFPVPCPHCGRVIGWAHQQWCDKNPNRRTRMFERRTSSPPHDDAAVSPPSNRRRKSSASSLALMAFVAMIVLWIWWNASRDNQDRIDTE
jgi:hypothetical protein